MNARPAAERPLNITSADILSALAKQFAAPEYAFLCEVRNSTGYARNVRTADALAMSLWPSRGVYLTGFEVKISRTDWLKEKKQPEKAEELARFCKHWFVATPTGLLTPGELPPNWGLIEVTEKGRLKYTKPAPEKDAQEPTWLFFAALMKEISARWTPTQLVEQRIADRATEIEKTAAASKGYREKNLEQELAEIKARLAKFEEVSGIKIDRYSEYFNGEIGQAVKILREMGTTSPLDRLVNARGQLQSLVTSLEALEKLVQPPAPVGYEADEKTITRGSVT